MLTYRKFKLFYFITCKKSNETKHSVAQHNLITKRLKTITIFLFKLILVMKKEQFSNLNKQQL